MSLYAFLIVSFIAIVFAGLLVTNRNAVHGALCLVVVLLAMAVNYLILSAEFIFVVQVAVYAGAVMVLFLFVMMLLNIQGSEDRLLDRKATPLLLSLALAVLLIIEIYAIGSKTAGLSEVYAAQIPADFGSPKSVGLALFANYFLPFQVIGVILLVAMMGAVVLAKRKHLQ